jgi:hypothetical protein
MHLTKSSWLSDQIRQVILTDFAGVMETQESTIGKFILIAVGIEFLGACLDKQHLNATARSEKRFNTAILKLFPNPYHHFVKPGSVPYLYSDFRCPVIHQFRAGKTIHLFSENEGNAGLHLTYNSEGLLILVAEEFYKDLDEAAQRLISGFFGKDSVNP